MPPKMSAIQIAEESRLRRIRLRRKFKAIVWLVMANLYWMTDEDDEELGEDVARNVALITRKKKKKEGKNILTKHDKGILMKDQALRTPEEKHHLHRIIGGLKCFRKYPKDVQMKLAEVSYFEYVPANRVIVKQNREGHALYFIMSGEVAVSITALDPVLNEIKTNVVGTMVAGQMFGEVSLLHNIPRTATITSIGDVELLTLMKDDFNQILKTTLQARWDHILNALNRFSYFTFFNEVDRREFCIYSKTKKFRKNEIVFDSRDKSHNVYFIIRGQCKLIEKIPIVHYEEGGADVFRLFNARQYLAKRKEMRTASKLSKKAMMKMSSMSIKQAASKNLKEVESITSAQQMIYVGEDESCGHLSISDMPNFVKFIFMEVCVLNELACFGLGENLRNRHVVAESDHVECMLIPRYWLMMRNKGNIWTRIAQYMNNNIPSTKEIFKIFSENRSWGRYKRQLVNKLRGKPPCNFTNNVPYSIRLAENINYGAKYV